MNRAGQRRLARTDRPGDQKRAAFIGGAPRLAQQLVHGHAARDDGLAPLPVVAGRPHRRRNRDGGGHALEQFLAIERLGEKAEGAALGRDHRVGNRAVGGEDDHRHARGGFVQPREQCVAVHAVHAQVGDDRLGLLGLELT